MAKVGIIGGSGLDDPDLFTVQHETDWETPWGSPSSSLREGLLGGVPVVLLARHGRRHTITPTHTSVTIMGRNRFQPGLSFRLFCFLAQRVRCFRHARL